MSIVEGEDIQRIEGLADLLVCPGCAFKAKKALNKARPGSSTSLHLVSGLLSRPRQSGAS
jgi:hypothetical protein